MTTTCRLILALGATALVGCGPRYMDLCPIPSVTMERIPERARVVYLGEKWEVEGSLTADDGMLFFTQTHYDDWILPICQEVPAFIAMESRDVDSQFWLMEGLRDEWGGESELMRADNNFGNDGPDAAGCRILRPGIYTIVATTRFPGETGAYTLHTSRSPEDWCRGSPDDPRGSD